MRPDRHTAPHNYPAEVTTAIDVIGRLFVAASIVKCFRDRTEKLGSQREV